MTKNNYVKDEHSSKSDTELVNLKVWSRSGVSRERLIGLFDGVRAYKIKYTPPGNDKKGELEVIAVL